MLSTRIDLPGHHHRCHWARAGHPAHRPCSVAVCQSHLAFFFLLAAALPGAATTTISPTIPPSVCPCRVQAEQYGSIRQRHYHSPIRIHCMMLRVHSPNIGMSISWVHNNQEFAACFNGPVLISNDSCVCVPVRTPNPHMRWTRVDLLLAHVCGVAINACQCHRPTIASLHKTISKAGCCTQSGVDTVHLLHCHAAHTQQAYLDCAFQRVAARLDGHKNPANSGKKQRAKPCLRRWQGCRENFQAFEQQTYWYKHKHG